MFGCLCFGIVTSNVSNFTTQKRYSAVSLSASNKKLCINLNWGFRWPSSARASSTECVVFIMKFQLSCEIWEFVSSRKVTYSKIVCLCNKLWELSQYLCKQFPPKLINSKTKPHPFILYHWNNSSPSLLIASETKVLFFCILALGKKCFISVD